MEKILLGLRNFSYDCEIFVIPAKFSQCTAKIQVSLLRLLFHWPLFLHPASCSLLFFFLFSSCFEILHSRLAEIDIRPYEIDGNQLDFGYDWIDTIIWLPIPAKTTKTPSECNLKCNRDPNMSIRLIIIISTQKALKTY